MANLEGAYAARMDLFQSGPWAHAIPPENHAAGSFFPQNFSIVARYPSCRRSARERSRWVAGWAAMHSGRCRAGVQ
jgi:hypothetical protein